MASQNIAFLGEPQSAEANPSRVTYLYPKLNYAKRSWIGVNLDKEERKLAEFYLEEAQRLAHMGSWAFNAAGFDYWSPELFRIHGLDVRGSAPTTEEYLALVHPEDRGFMKQAIEKMLADHRGFDFTKRIVRPDGELRYIRFVGVPVSHGAMFQGFVGTGMDVTEQEQSRQEGERREAYLAEAQRLSHTGSFGCKGSSGEMFWSEETFRIFGYDLTTTPAVEAILQRVHPEDRAGVEARIARAKIEGKDCDMEYRLLLPDDSIKHVHVMAHAVKDESGGFEFVGAVTDVTERKHAEEELQQLADFVSHIITVLSPDGKITYANRVAREYTGLTLDEYRSVDVIARVIHPDDVERMRAVRERGLSTNNPFEIEARTLGMDAVCRWFLYRYNPLHDQHGQITRWYVTGTDIEDRKQAEDRLRQENVALREEVDQASMFEEIVGTSRPLKALLSQVAKVAPTNSTVLITGETGTGKELVARALHKRSARSERGFVSVNCAAFAPTLISSELFGHEKGAFTGAMQRRLGRFELADGGTIFLDEVGELPPDAQVALLRVLQEREFERVGGTQSIKVDVRVIAATNRDLNAAVANGSFRCDLFYRLNVFPIEMPSLRERRKDIPLLVEYFIERYARKAGKKITTVDKKTLQLLESYPWPGNIRELQNVIERSVILCETESFSVDESWLPKQSVLSTETINQDELPRRLLAQEKDMIEAALKESRGRVFGPTGAAAKLGIPRSTLESKIRSLKIHKNRFTTDLGG